MSSQPCPRRSLTRDEFIAAFVEQLDRTSERGGKYTELQVKTTLKNACSALLKDPNACRVLSAAGVNVQVAKVLRHTNDLGSYAKDYGHFLDVVAPLALSALDLISAVVGTCRAWRKEGRLEVTQDDLAKVASRTASLAAMQLIRLVIAEARIPGSREALTSVWRRAGVLEPLAQRVAEHLLGPSEVLPRVELRAESTWSGARSVDVAGTEVARHRDIMVHAAFRVVGNYADAEDAVGDVVAQGLRSLFLDPEVQLTERYLYSAAKWRAVDWWKRSQRFGALHPRNANGESHEDSIASNRESLWGSPPSEIERVESAELLNAAFELLVEIAEDEWGKRGNKKWDWVSRYWEHFRQSPEWLERRAELRKHAQAWAKEESRETGQPVPRGFLSALERACELAAKRLRDDWS